MYVSRTTMTTETATKLKPVTIAASLHAPVAAAQGTAFHHRFGGCNGGREVKLAELSERLTGSQRSC